MSDNDNHVDKPRDDASETDQDKPVDVPNAATHRPPQAGGPDLQSPPKGPVSAEGDIAKGRNQNLDAKQPDPGRFQQEQRSQGMNRSS